MTEERKALIAAARAAISKVACDMSVSPGECRDALEDFEADIAGYKMALDENATEEGDD